MKRRPSPALRPSDGLCGSNSRRLDSRHYFLIADITGSNRVVARTELAGYGHFWVILTASYLTGP
jgi:hypothetical protein